MRTRVVYTNTGIGIGTILAMIFSWTANQSLFWLLIHGLLGWIYVIYYLIVYHF
ncbi:MAG: hypothetical protein HLUCCA01_02150 [Bacteroidetes bacterium HLUCCA01]|nr:MAG: hypothetical protein HLUCCA01_02150 [Bacteroidetes bacterium HLUCCA01]